MGIAFDSPTASQFTTGAQTSSEAWSNENRNRPTVWIVDDDEAITTMIGRIIESLGFEARAYNRCQEFLSVYDSSLPGCLLTDVSMPGMTGMELLRHLKEQKSLLPTILITGHGSIPMCVEAMRIGAYDFLQKPFSPAQLKELVQRAVATDRERQATSQKTDDVQARLASLSEEERQTLRLMLDGSMNKNIAAALDVSRRTVQYRISSLLEKMGVRSRSQLISLVTAANLATKS